MHDEPASKSASGEKPRWSHLHLWQIQPIRDVLIGLGIVGLILMGERVSIVTVPLLLALLLAYLFEPLIKRMTRASWISRKLAAGLLIFAMVVFVVLPALIGLGFAVVQGVGFAGKVASETAAVIASVDDPENEELRLAVGGGAWIDIRDFLVDLEREARKLDPAVMEQGLETEQEAMEVSFLGVDSEDLVKAGHFLMRAVRDNSEKLAKQAISTGTGALSIAVSTVTSFGKLLFGAFLTAFFFFFVSSGWTQVVEAGQGLVPQEKRSRFSVILARMDRAVHGFIRGRLTIAFFLAFFYSLGFWLIGVPAPLIVGPAVAVLTIIPYAAIIAIPVVIVLLWLEANSGIRGEIWWVIGAPIVYYNIGQALDDYVLTPMIQGKSTDLDTPTILFASIAGGALMGFYGLLIAIPIAACVKILCNEVFWPRFKAWTRGERKDFLPLDEGT